MGGRAVSRPATRATISPRFDRITRSHVVRSQKAGVAVLSPQDYVTHMADAKVTVSFELNGEPCEVAFAPHKTLLEVLREDLALTGTKHGCELGECGTCTVLVDGEPILSCLALALSYAGRSIDTVEGLAQGSTLHPLQEAFAELGAAQCGYCTPGFLLAAKSLLDRTPRPSRDEINDTLSGNLCRCTGYLKIYEAVEMAAERMRDAG